MKNRSTKKLPVGVIGLGAMGMNHVQAWSDAEDAKLEFVMDHKLDWTKAVANDFGVMATPSIDFLASKVTAVSIAVPTADHLAIGTQMLEAGVACLIEKPLALTEKDCQTLIHSASKGGAILQVGHIERFNPAFTAVQEHLGKEETIHAMSAQRLNNTSSRVLDLDVIMDLMIHDLDLMLALKNSTVKHINATAVRTGALRGTDHVAALLSFCDGSIATLTASRLANNQTRMIELTTDIGFYVLDCLRKRADFSRSNNISEQDTSRILTTHLNVADKDPLRAQLANFTASIRGEESPRVSGQDALEVMRLVYGIQNALDLGGNEQK